MATVTSVDAPFSLVSSETIPLTKAVAVAHRDMPASPTERTFSESRAKRLREAFSEGLLLPCQWAKATWQGKDVRMNGQHSSAVIAEMDPFPEDAYVHVDTYAPHSEQGMAMLFRQFDARISGRSAQDCAHAYQGLFPQVSDVPEREALELIKGINYYHRLTGEGEHFSGDDIGNLFFNRAYDQYLHWGADLLSGGKCGELHNKNVLAAVYGTYLASNEEAATFWTDVKWQSKDGSVSQKLDQQLDANKQQSDRKKKLQDVQLYGICVRAWNAHLAGDDPPRAGFSQPKGKQLPEIHSV